MSAVLLLALALAMDAFAVAIGLGAKQQDSTKLAKTALLAGMYFGAAQGIMPLIGYLGGKSVLGLVADFAPYIACGILLILGAKMLYEAFFGADNDDTVVDRQDDINKDRLDSLGTMSMLGLAIATSIDAMAAGFTLNLLAVNAMVSCAVIAVVTGLLSVVGVYIGQRSGTMLEQKAEIFGGIVLMAIGIKMLF